MKALDIEISKMIGEELHNLGYTNMSCEGSFVLPDYQRTKENVNDEGELTKSGAKIYSKDVLKNLSGVKDTKIIFGGSGYDVYALVSHNER